MPNHLPDLGDLDDSIFLSESKCYSMFFHLFYNFQFILYNTNQLTSNNVYKDNRLSGCIFLMINFVLDLMSTLFYHQKDSKLAYLASEQFDCEHLNE